MRFEKSSMTTITMLSDMRKHLLSHSVTSQEELYENFCEMMKAFDEPPLNLDHIDYLIKVKKENERKSNSN